MPKKFLFVSLFLVAASALGCQSASQTNTNSTNAGNGSVNAEQKNLPPEFSTSPVPPTSNSTPGIPAANAANVVPKGATPTPGIPDPKTLNKPMKPGATPTPGIPDPATIKRQMQGQSVSNVNTPPQGDTTMMPMKKKGTPSKP